MIIRQEEYKDFAEIRELVKSAFENAEHTDGNEYKLLDLLRKSDGFIKELALVAVMDDKIIGHIMFTKVKVRKHIGLALAPLSVLPDKQKKGVGQTLMNEAHAIAKELGYPFSIVLGDENYYPKVGYQKASLFKVVAPFEVPEENYMILFLTKQNFLLDGTVEYVKEMFEL
ncbi:GNAT family N-acetyltransferase [Tannockella kyphosi]|uniref:GNAT family N-acetyltransferase n=1 Tax=Tannockella kyphosi TaxID=2899121 RepID=UPI0020124DA9|nr:N-acetyltransferase [Tannockella kyphosi]